MSKRRVLILAIVFGVIGISEAFGQECHFVKYEWLEPRQLEVRQAPRMDFPPTIVRQVLKIELLSWPNPPPGWSYVRTIPTTTGVGRPTTGWILASRVGGPTNCRRAFRGI
jgi:hypothetical protein